MSVSKRRSPQVRTTGGGRVEPLPEGQGWRLVLPRGGPRYRLAQLDDYLDLPRSRFPWRSPVTLHLEARITPGEPPGTWGFGFWNDPFAFLGGAGRRLPTGPQAVWFFGASPPNWLSLHPEAPARGFFAGVTTWQAPWWAWLLTPGALLAAWVPGLCRYARRWTARWMRQWGRAWQPTPGVWHRYILHWEAARVTFWVDGKEIGASPLAPRGPLGLVVWVDNQFAAWPPDALPRWGVLTTPEDVVLDIRNLRITPG